MRFRGVLSTVLSVFTVLLVLTPFISNPVDAAAEEKVELTESWPDEGRLLWVPIREGRLEFSAPIRAADLTIELLDGEGRAVDGYDLERLTSGERAQVVLFQIPLLPSGSYQIAWSVASSTGGPVAGQGTVSFALDQPLAVAGGQNHRHGENAHLYQDSPGQFAIRLLFVLPVSLLLFSFTRTVRRGSRGRLDPVVLRLAGGLLVLVSLLTAGLDMVSYVDEYHDYPLSAALYAPGVLLALPTIGFGIYQIFAARADRVAIYGAVGVVLARAGAGHTGSGLLAVLLYLVTALALLALAATWSGVASMLADAIRRRPQPAGARRRAYATAAVLTLSSVSMLLLHARGFDLRMDFRSDLNMRLLTSLGALVLLAATARLCARPGLAPRLLALPLTGLLVAVSSVLAWMPPPSAGL